MSSIAVESNKQQNKMVCINCGSDKTSMRSRDNRPCWFKYKNGFICNKCYSRIIGNPKWNPRHMLYKNKQIIIEKRRLKGQCDWCGKKIGDEYINCNGKKAKIKRTSTHHIEYHDDDPLKDTVELCNSCHLKETRRHNSESY